MRSIDRLPDISGGSDGDSDALAAAQAREAAERAGGAPAPQFVPAEEFKKLEAQFGEMREMFKTTMEGVRAVVADRQARGDAPPPAEPAIEDVSDEELEQAILEGKPGTAKKLRQVIAAGQMKIEEAVKQLREEGLARFGEAARAEAVKLPYYERFKDEIEKYIAGLPATLRANSGVYKVAHDVVVGMHHDELKQEAVEQAIRGKQDEGAPGAPGRQAGRAVAGGGKIPGVGELLGAEAEETLRATGQSPDAFARRLGYGSWKDYAELYQQQQTA